MKKRLYAIVMTLSALAAVSVPALASDVTTAMTAGLSTLKDDAFSIILIALPIGLGIFGAFFGIRKGIALLRGIAK